MFDRFGGVLRFTHNLNYEYGAIAMAIYRPVVCFSPLCFGGVRAGERFSFEERIFSYFVLKSLVEWVRPFVLERSRPANVGPFRSGNRHYSDSIWGLLALFLSRWAASEACGSLYLTSQRLYLSSMWVVSKAMRERAETSNFRKFNQCGTHVLWRFLHSRLYL